MGIPKSFVIAQPIKPIYMCMQDVNGMVKLTGKIGPYRVVMFLDIKDCSDDEHFGYYYYVNNPQTTFRLVLKSVDVINLKGSMKLVMSEYTSKGFNSGNFYGQYECRSDYFVGTFINSKGQKYGFELSGEW